MDNFIIWLIIIAFYAPLHFVVPVLILFITGREDEATRKILIKKALIDSALSMALAFAAAIMLVQNGLMSWAMLVLVLSMPMPFIRILLSRRQLEE